jgi:chemotaxis signal transduction protein
MMTLDSAFITGIAKVGERLVILLDLSRVLSTQEQAELRPLRLGECKTGVLTA